MESIDGYLAPMMIHFVISGLGTFNLLMELFSTPWLTTRMVATGLVATRLDVGLNATKVLECAQHIISTHHLQLFTFSPERVVCLNITHTPCGPIQAVAFL